jgi:hypothetical protein
MMRRKGIFTLLTAAFMVLAFSAVTLAANNVRLTTTVPNIPKSTCFQAGTDTMEMDTLTQIREGDVIQFTLNNKVTVCKSIDMWLRIATAAGVLSTSADSPVATSAGSVNAIDGSHEWGFLIKAVNADTVAGQIITVQLRVRNTTTNELDGTGLARVMTFTGVALTDKLFVKLFDGKTVFAPNSGFFKALALTPTVYDTNIVATDNALCIDTLTQDYLEEYVQNTPDSLPITTPDTKLFFSGDYRIAHILSQQTYNLLTCKGAVCGHILYGTTGQTDSCVAFHFETTSGYCSDHKASKLIIQSSQQFEVTPYVVTLEILVNGVAGEHGVYFSNAGVSVGHYQTQSDACAGGSLAGLTPTYLKADGSTVAVPVSPISSKCDGVADAAKAVKITTAASNLGIVSGDTFLFFDLPPFNYNLAEVNKGDLVEVKITLSKSTCGQVATFTICIGTFGCPAAAATKGYMLFPYFSNAGADAFWNGIAIVNIGSTAGTVDIKAHQKNGTSLTFTTPSIDPNSMYVNMLELIPWVGTVASGDAGRCWVEVTTPTTAWDGFGMLANEVTGESMGYLPRNPYAVGF